MSTRGLCGVLERIDVVPVAAVDVLAAISATAVKANSVWSFNLIGTPFRGCRAMQSANAAGLSRGEDGGDYSLAAPS